MRKKVVIILMIGLLSSISGCTNKEINEKKDEITISVAASLTEPINKIKEEYESANNVKININTGGSGTLKRQISEGAEVDIFFSANEKFMNDLINEELVLKEEVCSPLRNSLVLVKNNAVSEKINKLDDLIGLNKKIALGEIETVPAGEYAKEALSNMNLWEGIETNVVYGKDVKAVKTYVESGDADFGFIYKSDAKDLKDSQIVLEVPSKNHKEIIYVLAPIKSSKNHKENIKIIEFITSNRGKEIFEEYGFNMGDK
ncbi:molybdate ABC transporter substrate-binding protein [Clostridium gasigenes]|uniref:molybdate ABC transporter substrate-binding protein n=1 Tax=Clostridium gasigenes TaxID=94869 RepID=UPI0014382E5B|nr:molybdate ABC transporter substrate-binding protein [Clostridium gasigenes]NKF07822.1 molybdate ABC transporter substrate-binding protein [Clostridium gasigenes]QSW20410.1 molybdate ABC transporter substrate-binding protein [Clostridium gasigenes]